ncbi:MAG: hypothetical protein JO362_03390 [Streptomycetaceae bacterium]|nr:hypothetical protein [Streptomycetaceae bacterium]
MTNMQSLLVIAPEETEETGTPPGPAQEKNSSDAQLVAIESLQPSDSPRVADTHRWALPNDIRRHAAVIRMRRHG